jgi:hypothetical protein
VAKVASAHRLGSRTMPLRLRCASAATQSTVLADYAEAADGNAGRYLARSRLEGRLLRNASTGTAHGVSTCGVPMNSLLCVRGQGDLANLPGRTFNRHCGHRRAGGTIPPSVLRMGI